MTWRTGVIVTCGALVAVSILLVGGCGPTGDGEPDGFVNASASRGGALYDKWWTAAGLAEPSGDHPLWAARPDQESNTRTGPDTWRCKECHGWDYQGVDGAYGSGSHRTGIRGILNTTLSAQEVFDRVKDFHGFGAMTELSDDDIWDLARFVLEGTIDTDDIIDANGGFIGNVNNGGTLYSTSCMACHGSDGLATPPNAGTDFEDYVGLIAIENPWEFQHKVRFGQPGTAMPALFATGTSLDDVADLSAFSQTLPEGP